MFFYVYVLKSSGSDRIYIGSTGNLIRRVKEHNLGLNQSTKHDRPWTLIYYEACKHRLDAKRREHYLKTNKGAGLLKRRLHEYFRDLLRFA